MSVWRLFGELPQARTREAIRLQSIEGWHPWQHPWTGLLGPPIVVPDPTDPSRRRHAKTYETDNAGAVLRFARDLSDDNIWRFYVPASIGTEGAFEAAEAKYEGHWRASYDEESELPWPKPEHNWAGRAAFLDSLDRVEAVAERVAYRGLSLCRMCGCRNGHEALRMAEWEWPAGFRHYLAAHCVRPSTEFEAFISDHKA
jgi:hypothetical protein